MRTYNLTQVQNRRSYAQLIQSRISLANKPLASGKRNTLTLAWIAGEVLLRKPLFCLKFIFFNDKVSKASSSSGASKLMCLLQLYKASFFFIVS